MKKVAHFQVYNAVREHDFKLTHTFVTPWFKFKKEFLRTIGN